MRNVELMWFTGRLAPDFKTIADFRHNNALVIRKVTPAKIEARQRQIEESIQRYLDALETADRTQPAEVEANTERLQDKIRTLREQMRQLDETRAQLKSEPPFMLTISVFEALRDAVAQAGGKPETMNAPVTAEEVLRAVVG